MNDATASADQDAMHDSGVDTGTIAWLLPELSSAFDAAITAVRNFRGGAAGMHREDVDLAPLRVARSHLHQAHGALEIAEIAGVTRVTEAIEELLARFESEPEQCDATALDAIVGGTRAIIEYLEDLQNGAPQQPLFLYPSYRELLRATGVDRIHPADLFHADLSRRVPRREDEARGAAGSVPLDKNALRNERRAFEQALLRYLRNAADTEAALALNRGAVVIEAAIASDRRQPQQRAFWWVARALFDALAHGGFGANAANDPHMKRLIGRINLQIRKLVDGSNAVAEKLFVDALYFVATAAPVTPHVRAVQEHYRLAHTIPDDVEKQRYGRVDAAVLRRAREVLGEAKAAWSAVVAGDATQLPQFAREAGALVDAVGPLKRRGLSRLAQVIDGIATDLGFDPRRPSANVGLDVATALLFIEGALDRARALDDAFDERAAMVVTRVEASVLGQASSTGAVEWLDRIARQAEERLTMATFVAEMQASLRSAEKQLDTFFRDPSERDGLREALPALAQVSGALALLGHDEPHRVIDAARETIASFQHDLGSSNPAAFQRIAQNLGAVGFYVEQMKRDRFDASAFHYDVESGVFSAEMARPYVPHPVDEAAVDEPVAHEAPPLDLAFDPFASDTAPRDLLSESQAVSAAPMPVDPAYAATQVIEPEETTAEEEMARHGDQATMLFADLRLHPEDTATRDRLGEAIEEVRRTAALIDDRALQDEASAALRSLRALPSGAMASAAADDLAAHVAELSHRASRAAGLAAAAPVDQPIVPVLSEEHADAIDAELLEIFLEEATTVLSDGRESLRVLDADPGNVTAMTNLRRGFHTLKGSGRMVGLTAFGEAAWAIEETLNGYLAEQAAAPTDLRALLDYAMRYMGDWVTELSAHGRSDRVADTLVDAARAARVGASPAAMPPLRIVPVAETPVAAPVAAPVAEAEDEPIKTAIEGAFDDERHDAPHDDFAKTELIHTSISRPEDTQWAATQFMGADDALLEIEFFGEQPVHREDATRIIEQIVAADADQEPAPALTPEEEERAFAKTLILDEFADAGPETPSASTTEGMTGSAVFANLFDEDFDTPSSPAVGPEAAPAPEPEVEPTPVETFFDEEVAAPEAIVEETIVAPVESARVDDTRRIGTLTLSVALFNIYLTEADELLRILTQDFAEWRHELDRFVSEGSVRAAHSLAGSSSTVGLTPAHDLAAAVEAVLLTVWREPTILTEVQVERLQEAVEALHRMLHRFAAERMPDAEPERVADLEALRRELSGEGLSVPVVELPESQVAEAVETIDFAPEPEPEAAPAVPASLECSIDAGEGVTAVAMPDVMDTEPDFASAPDLESASLDDLEMLAEESRVDEMLMANDAFALADLPLDEPVEASVDAEAQRAVVETSDVARAEPAPVEEPAEDVVAEAFVAPEPTIEEVVAEAVAVAEVAPQPTHFAPIAVESNVRDEIDPDLLEVFTAEANEILPQIGGELRTWQAHPSEPRSARLLLRHLHTLKGSARMAGAMRLGEVVHDLEARVEGAARLQEVPSSLLDELLAVHDRSIELFESLHQPEAVVAGAVPAAPVEEHGTFIETAILPAEPRAEVAHPTPAGTTPDPTRPRDKAPVQAVRVSSEVLDRLVNLAGEVSISRARIQNEVTSVKQSLAELSENVERLRAQLREVELQAEFQLQSQMQSQHASGTEREKFDPLEFDRFTRFQELTRMMAESVNDVKTLQQNLHKSVENTETDLASQRRMTRDLQQDLMRVRMVPFSNVAERLYRVARRAAKEVDKRVNLDIRGGSVEIDRGVLERMAGPFEHMLRNHIVHGIETRGARRAAGKDETGELLVEVRQEGNEMVLTFSDDGAGLDYERIRTKARELGLIGPHEVISDTRAAEFIFHPGFSTATAVTELAGRGVGMDVVRAEAVLLAGRVSVDSEKGRGTRFTINLPLTLAVTQVVLVAVAGHTYALPAVLVEQVQQLRPQPLADAYRAGALEWAGAKVKLAFLGSLLAIEQSVPVAQRSSPVLILRSGGERVAVHVDEVIGNQEVVVKNLGPQLARMTGIAGATILGSGAIVLILNPVQLAQVARAHEAPSVPATTDAVDATSSNDDGAVAGNEGLKTLPTVMVVDDSLTVRRVTQRLLSREGYQVVLAKDGVDALEQLQDYPPDAMLVDIEMPRMDGFDLTRNVRNDARLRHIPILMITSRTAEKHRQHAMSLGVDEYLGKPYQEDELLELLARHVKTKRAQLV